MLLSHRVGLNEEIRGQEKGFGGGGGFKTRASLRK